MAHDTFTEAGKKIADEIVAELNNQKIAAKIGMTYRDYGQGWTWDTILVGEGSRKYQAINPRQFDAMNEGHLPIADIMEIITTAQRIGK